MSRPLRALVRLGVVMALGVATACSGSTPTIGPNDTGSTAATAPASTPPGSTDATRKTSASTSPSPSPSTTTQPSGSSTTNPPATTQASACRTDTTSFLNRAPGTGKTVALTFDDGPGPFEAQIATILAQRGIPATFFETGEHATAYPGDITSLAAAGFLIGSHSTNHRYPAEVPGGWTLDFVRDQLTSSTAVLRKLSGQPVCVFRPPGGFRDNVLAAAVPLGLTSWMWSVDSADWQQPGQVTEAATARIVANATAVGGQSHPVVLMHAAKASHEPDSVVSPFRGNTVAALPRIIDWYASHGYTFVDLAGHTSLTW